MAFGGRAELRFCWLLGLIGMSWKPIFFDPTSRRKRYVSWLTGVCAVVSTVMAVTFAYGMLIMPQLPILAKIHTRQLSAIPVANPTATPQLQSHIILKYVTGANSRPTAKVKRIRMRNGKLVKVRTLTQPHKQLVQRQVTSMDYPLLMPIDTTASRAQPYNYAGQNNHPLSVGFYTGGDEESFASLTAAISKLDWLSPTWLSVIGDKANLEKRIDRRAIEFIRATRPSIKILPLLQNAKGENWDGAGTARLLANREERLSLVGKIVAFLAANNLQGIVVDLESLPKSAQPDLAKFLGELRAEFAPRGWLATVAMPFADPSWDERALAKASDFVILMGYDEHENSGTQGAIASQDWYVRNLTAHMQKLDPAHTIVALASYGYDWKAGGHAQAVTFRDAIQMASDATSSITFDHQSLNPHYAYSDETGAQHDVWMLDAVTAYNQIRAADAFRPAGYALWRLGSEDPSIWSVFGQPNKSPVPAGLSVITASQDIEYEGNGEIMQIASEPMDGVRAFNVDAKYGIVTNEDYQRLPSDLMVTRFGAEPNKIALTFDDGPNAEWTPSILDVLKEKGVHASFFIVGVGALANPSLVERMVAEGHDVGNHTFTHPNLSITSDEVVRIELNANQRLFQALTGRAMRFFRPPYVGDAQPDTPDAIKTMRLAQEMGYFTVGLKVDPDDWQQPDADLIIERVLKQVSDPNPETRGQIVLLHDSGGDRAQTLLALPRLIDALRAKGFTLVPVSTLAGMTQDQAMPPFPTETLMPTINSSMFQFTSWARYLLGMAVIGAIALGMARLFTLVGLAAVGKQNPAVPPRVFDDFQAKVSVLIPAFNEAQVIEGSLRRILDSHHRNLEVIVIDDGSTDDTYAALLKHFSTDPRVRLLTVTNGGKANAINAGLRFASGDVVVALDADTQFERDTITKLTRWFDDPQIGAVAGNAKVGNRVNLLTRWQALEYVTAQNLERRALAVLDCMTVVPGAVGAWRRSVLAELGGFPSDTLAEDQDLTIAVQKAGYRVIFDSDAIAWTEAPATVRALAKQRFRWSFGTLQCLWKHRAVTLNPRYGALGLVAIPQVWLFQILLALFAPMVDLMLVLQVLGTYVDYLHHGAQFDTGNIGITLVYYALFMAVDLFAAAVAFSFERKEQWSLLWWLVLQRFVYRQLMYYVVVKSVASALMGHFVGWGKIERKATVMIAAE